MSLALVQISLADFQHIHGHISTATPYRNMHLREMCQQNKKRRLRYLHAIYATPGKLELEGKISGPGVFWHYKLNASVGGVVRFQVFVQHGPLKERTRIQQRFLPEIMKRVAQEQKKQVAFPKLTKGQFYLRRWQPGMISTHPNCQAATSTGVLDQRFVSQLHAWNLMLIHK